MVKISIIVPSYNNAKFLSECIESALTQTFDDFELIIVEGGSSDNSLEIIKEYAKKDDRIRVIIHPQNLGVSRARNDGILASSGDFIAILDSDDIMLPTRIEELYNEISKNSNYGLVHSDVYVINEIGEIQGKIIGKEHLSKGYICGEVLRRRGCHIGYPMFRKTSLLDVGLYDESLRGGEDYDLYTRITQYYPVAYVQKPLILYRRHGSNTSSKLHLMVNDYKRYLDKTFENDKGNMYTKIMHEAYVHYYLDKMNLDFLEDKKKFLLRFVQNILNFIKKQPTLFFKLLYPFCTIFSIRICSIIRKKIAFLCKVKYVQIGW
ncbi:glycosyltransferase [Methanospirillum sp.]|mgnify:CR=1 FL=1|uniref:glycosyltransferase family 2 protein n=1 Tax=Methanospirillum sp. TaxID=45200 RepID=UPI002BAFD392|nr:glycosyltransferase [Methanospirillum sp.]HPP77916.1 glycosyltransferase [Methanospirillum sp.]